MSLLKESKQTIVFTHEENSEPEVKTQVLKMFRARFGGKLTASARLIDGTGEGSLYIGSSNIHNPQSGDVNLIMNYGPWSSNSEIFLDKELVTYPFLVLSADFTDTNAATVEVEVQLSWSMRPGL